MSSSAPLLCGVPQGPILNSILFSSYMLPLGDLPQSFCHTSYHCYADDTQLYFSFKPNNLNNLTTLHDCLVSVTNWMSQNFPHLSPDKTAVLVIGPDYFCKVSHYIRPLAHTIKSASRNLGILPDQHLNFEPHSTKLIQSCLFQLRNIAKIKPQNTPKP